MSLKMIPASLFVGLLFFCAVTIQGNRVKDLNCIIEEYKNSLVLILKYSKSVELDPITDVPVVVVSLEQIIKFKNPATPSWLPINQFTTVSAFLLFPQKKKYTNRYSNLKLLSWSLDKYFDPDKIIYFNIFIDSKYNTRQEGVVVADQAFYSERIHKFLSVYNLQSTDTVNHALEYKVTAQYIALVIPTVKKMKLFEFGSCIQAQMSTCRSAIDRQSHLWHTDRLLTVMKDYSHYINHAELEHFNQLLNKSRRLTGGMKDSQDIYSYYINHTLHPPFYRGSDIVQFYFNNPFKRYRTFSFEDLLTLLLNDRDHWVKLDKSPFRRLTDSDVRYLASENLLGESLYLKKTKGHGERCENLKTACHLVRTGDRYMTFVTCDGVIQYTGFSFYLAPYDLSSWITFTAFTFFLIPSTVFLLYQTRKVVNSFRTVELKLIFSTIFFNVSLVLENGPIVPPVLAKLSHGLKSFNWMLSIWALMSVILVNAYKGIVTTELTASSPPLKQTYETINQTTGFTFVVPPEFWQEISDYPDGDTKGYSRPFLISQYNVIDVSSLKGCLCYPEEGEMVNKICNRPKYYQYGRYGSCANVSSALNSLPFSAVKSSPTPQYCEYYSEYLDQGDIMASAVDFYRKYKKLPEQKPYIDIICTPIHAVYPSSKGFDAAISPFFNAIFINAPQVFFRNDKSDGIYFESVINITSDCQGIGYIDYEFDTDVFIETSLHTGQGPKYQKGKEKLFDKWDGIIIEDSFATGRDELSRKYKVSYRKYKKILDLMATGIFHIWDAWYRIHDSGNKARTQQKFLQRTRVNRAQGINMNSNIKTVFIIYSICTFICTCIFCAEDYRVIYYKFNDLIKSKDPFSGIL